MDAFYVRAGEAVCVCDGVARGEAGGLLMCWLPSPEGRVVTSEGRTVRRWDFYGDCWAETHRRRLGRCTTGDARAERIHGAAIYSSPTPCTTLNGISGRRASIIRCRTSTRPRNRTRCNATPADHPAIRDTVALTCWRLTARSAGLVCTAAVNGGEGARATHHRRICCSRALPRLLPISDESPSYRAQVLGRQTVLGRD